MTVPPHVLKLGDIWQKHLGKLPAEYLWEDEGDREIELYYCVLREVNKDAINLRELVTLIGELGLFETEALAQSKASGAAEGKGEELASTILKIFLQNGMEEAEAKESVRAICETARIIRDRFKGKIQKFLRVHAQKMLEELTTTFSFSDDKLDKKSIFTMWLQNVQSAPIISIDSDVKKFMEEQKLTETELLDAADNLDINAMVIDDIIRFEEDEQNAKAS